MKNKKGFTLSEMLVVIAIIAIITVIAVPSIIVVNKNINKRLLSSKKEHIITAAELYGTDNPDIFNGKTEVKVYVSELIQNNYLDSEATSSDDECNKIEDESYKIEEGCVVNPVDKVSMNDSWVLLKQAAVGVVGEFGAHTSPEDDGILTVIVCEKLENGTFVGKDINGNSCNCSNITSGLIDACLISGGSDVNNYLKYDDVMWRVMGIYNVQQLENPQITDLSAKMINDDNVEIVVN